MDKKEYIERKEVNSEINKLPLTEDAAMEILWAIDHIPTADVAPVVHAKWLIEEYEYLTCSRCGDDYYTGMDSTKQAEANLIDGEVPKYCPNCGAKMDGEPHDP